MIPRILSSPNEKMPSPESDTKVSKWYPRAEISPIFASAAHMMVLRLPEVSLVL